MRSDLREVPCACCTTHVLARSVPGLAARASSVVSHDWPRGRSVVRLGSTFVGLVAVHSQLLVALALATVWLLILLSVLSNGEGEGRTRAAVFSIYVAGAVGSLQHLLDPSGVNGWSTRVGSVAYVGVLIAALAILGQSRSDFRVPLATHLLAAYGILLFVMGVATNSFDRSYLVLPFLAYLVGGASLPIDVVVRHARNVLRFTTLASLLVLAVGRADAVFVANGRVLLGFDQLSGVTPHPNVLGPVAAFALALELHTLGGRRRWGMNGLGLLAAVATCVLAQSHSGWLAALLVLLIYSLRRRSLEKVFWLIGTASVVGLYFLPSDDARGRVVAEALNGRQQIWGIALSAFRENPLLGGGPGVFASPDFLASAGRYAAVVGQAHNQFIETMGQLGLLGAALLVAMLSAWLFGARSHWTDSWVPASAFTVILLYSLSESPLRGNFTLPTFLAVITAAIVGSPKKRQVESKVSLVVKKVI